MNNPELSFYFPGNSQYSIEDIYVYKYFFTSIKTFQPDKVFFKVLEVVDGEEDYRILCFLYNCTQKEHFFSDEELIWQDVGFSNLALLTFSENQIFISPPLSCIPTSFHISKKNMYTHQINGDTVLQFSQEKQPILTIPRVIEASLTSEERAFLLHSCHTWTSIQSNGFHTKILFYQRIDMHHLHTLLLLYNGFEFPINLKDYEAHLHFKEEVISISSFFKESYFMDSHSIVPVPVIFSLPHHLDNFGLNDMKIKIQNAKTLHS